MQKTIKEVLEKWSNDTKQTFLLIGDVIFIAAQIIEIDVPKNTGDHDKMKHQKRVCNDVIASAAGLEIITPYEAILLRKQMDVLNTSDLNNIFANIILAAKKPKLVQKTCNSCCF